MSGLLWLLLVVTCVTAQTIPSGTSSLSELLAGSAIGMESSKSLASAIPSSRERPSKALKDQQENEGKQLLGNSPLQEQLRMLYSKRASRSDRYSKNGVSEQNESERCSYVCSNCYKVISLRLAALCSSQCRSNGYAFQACSVAWNQLRYILLPNGRKSPTR